MKKRILSIVLVLCMVLSFVPITVFAAGGDKTVSLGTDVIKNPTAPTASTDTWKGSYVYFGTYGGNPVKYRVLDKNTTVFGGTTMLLDCDSILWAGRNPSSAFDDNSNDWANSNIRTYLNGTFLTSNFSTAEQNAIASSTKSAEYSTDGNGWIGTLSYASLSNDKIFFLDAKEATNTSYGYSNNAGSAANREKTGGNAVWWLRSAYTFDANYAGMVYPGGGLGKGVLGKYVGVSPALNINLSSVLFTSAAEGGKADTAVDGDLTAVSDYTGSEWKLTLLDSSRDSFSISGATVNNGTIRFSYSGAQTGTNEYISAVVVESGTITHYGRIFQLDGTTYGANGTASLSLPAGVTLSENTKLYVFNEQYNGDYQTDYASALKVVLPQETTPNATFTATGDNDGTLSNVDTSMKYSVDGGTTWNAVTGTTMDISSVTAEKDVKVYKPGNGTTTVDSEVQTIDVTQAVQPTGVDKADCTTSQQNDGQITGVDTTMEYRLSGTSGWTAVTVNPVTGLGSGSYEVRVKASGTVLASGTVIVTIGAHTCVAQGDWQHDGTGHWKLCACGAKIEEAAHSGDTASYFEKAACDYCHTEYGNLLTDTTAPTGEIAVGTNKWNSFLNTITFGLFFKDTQSVTITATDDSYDHAGFDDDKAVKVEYYLYSGDTALTKEDLASKEFTIYDGGFNINPDNKYVIYARLTDHAGNVTYISSEGVVLDASAPVISGVENGKTYCEAQTVTVMEEYIESVKVNGTAVTLDANNQFTLNPAESTQTIVVTDKAGNEISVTVTVNDGHTYEWQSENSQYWKKCQYCGYETAKKDIPTITIDAPDTVCRTQDCEASVLLPENIANAELSFAFIGLDSKLDSTVEDGRLHGVVPARHYPGDGNSFNLVLNATTDDGFLFTVRKNVKIQNEHAGGVATCIELAICDTCGEHYGEFDSSNHNLEKIPAKDATVTATGNKEYWHCKDCKKYFSDAAGTNEIKLDDTVIAKLSPEIIEGKGQSITAGEKKELIFKSNASFSDFIRVELDGKTLDEKNYTVKEGSTVVTLKADYVATLSVGKHTIGIVSTNGTATTTFTVKAKTAVDNDTDSPQTGDNSRMALWIALLFVSGAGVIGTTVYGKKKRAK